MAQQNTRNERDAVVEDAVVALLSVATVVRPNESNRGIVLECRLCGELDEYHTDACPVPALEQWLNPISLRLILRVARTSDCTSGSPSPTNDSHRHDDTSESPCPFLNPNRRRIRPIEIGRSKAKPGCESDNLTDGFPT